jgi:hypothetical protein
LQTDLRQFLNTPHTHLQELEEAQEELYEAQTWLLQNSAPLYILANQETAVTYLSNHHHALIQLNRITSHLLAIVQPSFIPALTLKG